MSVADTSSFKKTVGIQPAPPCTIVIFGASGDLTKRLVSPALYNLSASLLLDPDTRIIGVDQTRETDETWRQGLTDAMRSFTTDLTAEFHVDRIDEASWQFIVERLHFYQGDFENPATYEVLAAELRGNVVFYLAVASRFFGTVVEGLGRAGLLRQADGHFRRVIIEKPFGADLASARTLNARILRMGDESQFFRIDHFLGKEAVQSVMALRFANSLFEPTWRREYIDHVEITAAETVGVEGRGAFYEPTGALRDMVPNHLFQLLSVLAMEPPGSFGAEAVRTEKAKLVEAVLPVDPADVVRGQYLAGTVLGGDVPAYRDETRVSSSSRTETYIAMRLAVENWRWMGVPFYLRTGKRMTARRTEIVIYYKAAPYRTFRDTAVDELAANVLRLQIDPVSGISTEFRAKVPGPLMRLGDVRTTMHYGDFFAEKPNVGYETLIYDCMVGDATLFQRADHIEAGWAAMQPAIDAAPLGDLDFYRAGSAGPDASDRLLARAGHRWSELGGA